MPRLHRLLIRAFTAETSRHVKDGFLSVSVQAAAEYASVLEFGFTGTVNVQAHSRRGVPVKAHTRQMNRPARPHIVPAAERALKQLIGDLEGLKV